MLFRIFTVVAIAALAIVSWFLSAPGRTPNAPDDAARAERPGYFLKDAVLTDYDELGEPVVRVAAARIDQIAHGSEVALAHISVNYQSPAGTSWVMQSDAAQVEPGGSAIDMTGNVRLQGLTPEHAGAAVIHTDALTYAVANSVASTKSDVRVDFAGQTLTARGLIANLKERTIRLESRISGRFHP